MKIIKQSNPTFILSSITTSAIILLLLVSLNACVSKKAFLVSSVVPAAQGSVKIKKDNNGNYNIAVFVRNLADVSRLQPAKKAYVVWIIAQGEMAKNVGLIDSGTKLFSKKLKASFQTVSPTKPSKVFITAEDDITTQVPNYVTILETNTF